MTPPIIIAEAGVNHNGDINIAKKLIDIAKDARSDVIKFQFFKADDLASPSAPKADYQKKNTENENNCDNQLSLLRSLELSKENLKKLFEYASSKGIVCTATPFSETCAVEIADLVTFWKISSGEINNFPFLKHLASYLKPIVLSSGMSSLNEIKEAINCIFKTWGNQMPKSINIGKKTLPPLTVLHCVSSYPAPMESVNLKAMVTICKEFNIPIGLSDHTLGIEIPVAATALGATVIEKHITLDKCMTGPDHKSSIEPDELKTMIFMIENVFIALGSGEKHIHHTEKNTIDVARKSIHLNKDKNKGSILNENDICMLRPGTGIPPGDAKRIIGKRLKNSLEKFHLLRLNDLV